MILPQSVFPDEMRPQRDLDKLSESLMAGLDMNWAAIDLEDALAGGN